MPDKKKKGEISATELHGKGALVPSALTAQIPPPETLPDYDWKIASRPKQAPAEDVENILATRDFIVPEISVHAHTVKEAMPELRKRFFEALTASVQECQLLRTLHEKNTGRQVGKVTLNADSMVKHVVVNTVAYEEPDKVVRMIEEALAQAAIDFEEMKELPTRDHVNATQQNLQARRRRAADKKPATHANMNPLLSVPTYGVVPTQKKTVKAGDRTRSPNFRKEIENASEKKYNEAVKSYVEDKTLEVSPEIIAEGSKKSGIQKIAKYAEPIKEIGGQVSTIITIYKIGTEKESPIAAIFPVDMFADPKAAELESILFNTYLNEGYERINNFINQVKDNSRNPIYELIKSLWFIYLNDEQLKQFDEGKLDLNNNDLFYRTEKSKYAILVGKQGKEIFKIKQYILNK